MEEKTLKEMVSILRDIREKIDVGSVGALRGPVADPAPDWRHVVYPPPVGINWVRGPVADPAPEWGKLHRGPMQDLACEWPGHLRGPIADPAPWHILDKVRVAKLKISKLDMAITELENQIEFLKLEKDLLKEEYNIK
ncbi:MAG: hypothetical protein JSV56_09420 [Methanomassiliicoccales archaeon]|nr:MAG: hypothetical protein JSV56_09420 [Methanomassiliicoccales archaeon]